MEHSLWRVVCLLTMLSNGGAANLTLVRLGDVTRCISRADSALAWTFPLVDVGSSISTVSEWRSLNSGDHPDLDSLTCDLGKDKCSGWSGLEKISNLEVEREVDLGPVLDHRWEDFPLHTTDGGYTYRPMIPLNERGNTVSGTRFLHVSLLARENAYLILSRDEDPHTSPVYWIVLDGWSSKRTVLRKCPYGVPNKGWPSSPCTDIRDEHDEYAVLQNGSKWVHLTVQLTRHDYGSMTIKLKSQDKSEILSWTDQMPSEVNYLSVRTHDKMVGYWKLHQYQVARSPDVSSVSVYSEKSQPLCLSVLQFSAREGNEIKVVSNQQTTSQSFKTGGWQETRLELNLSAFENYNFYVTPFENNDLYLGDIRVCNDKEIHVSTLSIKSNAECVNLKTKESVKMRPIIEGHKIPFGCQGRHCDLTCWLIFGREDCRGVTTCSEEGCSCLAGYMGASCTQGCSDNFYGPNCALKCTGHCAPSDVCNPGTGECPGGCEERWTGEPLCGVQLPMLLHAPQLRKVTEDSVEVAIELNDIVSNYTVTQYKLQVKEKLADRWRTVQTRSIEEDLTMTLTDLTSNTNYLVRVVLKDQSGAEYFGEQVQFLQVTSLCRSVDEYDIEISAGETYVKVNWNIPKDGQSCSADSYNIRVNHLPHQPINVLPVTLGNLIPYSSNVLEIFRDENLIVQKTFWTQEGAPGKIENLQVSASDVAATVSWSPPAHSNGVLTKYLVSYQHLSWTACGDLQTPRTVETVTVPAAEDQRSSHVHHQTVISKLQPFSKYLLSVIAATRLQGEPEVTYFSTQQGTPSEGVRNLKVQVDTTSADLTWDEPSCDQVACDVTSYEIVFRGGTSRVPANTRRFRASNLDVYKDYKVQVSAVCGASDLATQDYYGNNPGELKSSPYFLQFKSGSRPPPAPRDLESSSYGADWVLLQWSAPSPPRGQIERYHVTCVNNEDCHVGGVIPCEHDRWRECCTVRNLKPGRQYTFKVSAKNVGTDFGEETTIFNVTTAEEGPSALVIALPVTLLLLVVGVILIVCWRRRTKPPAPVEHQQLQPGPGARQPVAVQIPLEFDLIQLPNRYNQRPQVVRPQVVRPQVVPVQAEEYLDEGDEPVERIEVPMRRPTTHQTIWDRALSQLRTIKNAIKVPDMCRRPHRERQERERTQQTFWERTMDRVRRIVPHRAEEHPPAERPFWERTLERGVQAVRRVIPSPAPSVTGQPNQVPFLERVRRFGRPVDPRRRALPPLPVEPEPVRNLLEDFRRPQADNNLYAHFPRASVPNRRLPAVPAEEAPVLPDRRILPPVPANEGPIIPDRIILPPVLVNEGPVLPDRRILPPLPVDLGPVRRIEPLLPVEEVPINIDLRQEEPREQAPLLPVPRARNTPQILEEEQNPRAVPVPPTRALVPYVPIFEVPRIPGPRAVIPTVEEAVPVGQRAEFDSVEEPLRVPAPRLVVLQTNPQQSSRRSIYPGPTENIPVVTERRNMVLPLEAPSPILRRSVLPEPSYEAPSLPNVRSMVPYVQIQNNGTSENLRRSVLPEVPTNIRVRYAVVNKAAQNARRSALPMVPSYINQVPNFIRQVPELPDFRDDSVEWMPPVIPRRALPPIPDSHDDDSGVLRPQRDGLQVPERPRRATSMPSLPQEVGGEESWSRPILAAEMEDYVTQCLATGELRRQYELFPRGQTQPWHYGDRPENRKKNRYGNLKAYDATRVKLEPLSGVPFSDYINANYIDGYHHPRAYIATQGPKPSTVLDFWRMVWQEKVHLIVMLANLVENGKPKCEQYWPEVELEVRYGSVAVKTKSQQVFADYTFRNLRLRKGTEARRVLQMHFTSWPDHGVPKYPQAVATFVKKMLRTRQSGPVVVHCSAGVGRTGTVILADSCLRMAAAEGRVDPLAMLHKMRAQRANLVDNPEQFELVHVVLLECLVADKCGVACAIFPQHFESLMAGGGQQLRRQFAALNKTCGTDDTSRQLSCWPPHKSRFSHIVPGTEGRVLLSNSTSDFINAVCVDGFRSKSQFIATQLPLPDTLPDFWTMVEQCGVGLVIVLNQPRPEQDHSECDLLPCEGSEMILSATSSLEMTKQTSSRFCDFARLHLLSQISVKGRMEATRQAVNVVTLKGWGSEQTLPPQGHEVLLEVLREAEVKYQGRGPIVITCHDGATASGLLLAANLVIEKIKHDHEADVGLAVRTVRRTRPQFITSIDQFSFLHEMALHFIRNFDFQ